MSGDQNFPSKLRILGAVFLLALTALVGISFLRGERERDLIAQERSSTRIVEHGSTALDALQDMARLQEGFLLQKDRQAVAAFRDRHADLRRSLDAMTDKKAAEDARIGDVRAAVARYRDAFDELAGSRIALGIVETEGLEGRLRAAVHSMESRLDAFDDLGLVNKMLMMRRHEKDYMMRLKPDYLARFDDRVSEFRAILGASDRPAADLREIGGLLTSYAGAFHAWADMRTLIAGRSETAETEFAEARSGLDTLVADARLNVEQIDAASQAMRAQMRILFWVLTGICLTTGASFAALYTHSRDFGRLLRQREQLNDLADENFALANLDPLTGLPNRRSFINKLEELTLDLAGERKPFMVGILDLDGFKLVNDVYGHPVGDKLLCQAGERLGEILGADAVLARLGGDEYGLLCQRAMSDAEIRDLGDRICRRLSEPFDLDGDRASVAASLGVARYPNAGLTRSELFERADYALYHAKQNGKGHTVIFSGEHELSIRRRSRLEHQIRQADLEAELYIMFQPICDARANRVLGFEALARWKSPVLGEVSPVDFIAAAEQIGQVSRLTPILLRKAIASAQTWSSDLFLSFNLSALDLNSVDAARNLVKIVETSGFPAERLIFEVTETAVMRKLDRAREVLNILKACGAQIALDDFGTGYSSLSYVSSMPFDKLKIDRSFVDGVDTRKEVNDVVRTISDLCRNLNLTCIVEGVETTAQLDSLTVMGLNQIQGYLFSRPLLPHAVKALLEAEAAGQPPQTTPVHKDAATPKSA